MTGVLNDDDISEVLDAAQHVEELLKPHAAETAPPEPTRAHHVNWRETELGIFEEEAVRELYKHAR